MKFKDIEKLSEDECLKQIAQLQKEKMKIEAQVATGSAPPNAGTIRKIRRDIARLFTVLNRGMKPNE